VHDLQYIQRRVGSKAKAKLMLFGEFSGRRHSEEVRDPYYGARDGFDVAYEQCVRFSTNFLTQTFPHTQPRP
jgi:low molecular weight phosphotyrosine protein phosphatase